MSDIEKLIKCAIAEGRIHRFPSGATGIVRKPKPACRVRFHQDYCGKGEQVSRRPFLDEADQDLDLDCYLPPLSEPRP